MINVIDPGGFCISPTLLATRFNEPLTQTRRSQPRSLLCGRFWATVFPSTLQEECLGRAPGQRGMFSANTLRSDCSSVTIMYPLEETTAGSCSGCQQQHPHGILYGILSGQKVPHLDCTTAASNCHCEQRTVCLKDPKTTCLVASNVLVKTMRFLRSLPSFRQLPQGDQLVLLEYSWVPLFVLGLAQDKILFEVTDRPSSSLLRKILLGPGGSTEKEVEQPTLRDVCKLRSCLHQLWNLDLSPKEYAYLKGALLFNPGKTVSFESHSLIDSYRKV